MLRMNVCVPPAEDELESPVDSLSNLSLDDEATDAVNALPKPKPLVLARPELSVRSSTDPSPSVLLQGYFANVPKRNNSGSSSSSNNRNRSPYSRSHLRSRSSGTALLSAPTMTRAHSMPNPHIFRTSGESGTASSSSGSLSPAPHSPMRSPARVRSPFRDDSVAAPPRSPSFGSGAAIESISEDSELDITKTRAGGPSIPPNSASASFSRSGSLRRRPASPLHNTANVQAVQQPSTFTPFPADSGAPTHTTSSSGSSSPALGPQRPERFNESYPSLHHYASTSSFSSMPSTPTSARSRSPSISSLDTIEDAPDLESEAIEHERMETLKLAAERQERMERGEDVDDVAARRRSSLDVPRSGFGRAGRERKRWSICGGERRADLDLETIWED